MVDDNGCFHIVTEQDCDATIQAVHDAGSVLRRHTGGDGARYMGSVPLVQAQIWAKECGFPVGSRGWTDYSAKKLNSVEFAKLRAQLK